MFGQRSGKLDRFTLKAVKHLCLYEGEVHHLYLDSHGRPTIGVNFHFHNRNDFAKLELRELRSKRSASRETKLQEYDKISKLPAGYVANFYSSFCTLYIPHTEIQRVLALTLNRLRHELAQHYTDYDNMPQSAQLAILDLAYQLGLAALPSQFPELDQAIAKEQWHKASQLCARKQVSQARNDKTKQLFLRAEQERDSLWYELLQLFRF